jgi:hypothetical protein
MRQGSSWTPEEDATLLRLRAEKVPYAEISVKMDRTEKAIDSRFRIITMTEAKRRERMDRRNLLKKEGRWAFRNVTNGPAHIPDCVMTDRAERLNTARTLTATFFGDPPHSQSALFKKSQGVTA